MHLPHSHPPDAELRRIDRVKRIDLPAGAPFSDWIRYAHHCPTIDFRHWREDEHYRDDLESLLHVLQEPMMGGL